MPASRHTCLLHRALGADNLCRISSGNVLAFSSSGGPEEGLNVSARGYHVFVADLNTPWDIHLLVLNRRRLIPIDSQEHSTRKLLL